MLCALVVCPIPMLNRYQNIPFILRYWLVRPRLLSALLLGCLTYALLPLVSEMQATTRILISWNIGIIWYLILSFHMMQVSSKTDIHDRARVQCESRWTELALINLTTIAILAAITGELMAAKDLPIELRYGHVALAALTIITAWLFIQVMFTLHYAHHYYTAMELGHKPGIDFPGNDIPNYSDFFYCACIIGTSGQTADVSFSTTNTRHIALVHSVLAFFFNTTLLALTINIASSLF